MISFTHTVVLLLQEFAIGCAGKGDHEETGDHLQRMAHKFAMVL